MGDIEEMREEVTFAISLGDECGRIYAVMTDCLRIRQRQIHDLVVSPPGQCAQALTAMTFTDEEKVELQGMADRLRVLLSKGVRS